MIPLTNEFFDTLRFYGDPQTDTMVDGLIVKNQIEHVNEILRLVTYNKDAIPAALPDDLEVWFQETSIVPAWVDPERIQSARDFFHRNGLIITLILSTASLIDCFSAKKGVKVLVRTGILQRKTYIRLVETAQFVFNIMEPDGLEPTGKGIVSIQKVRLMHTATRRLILASQEDPWDKDELGLPVCQEDLLGTLMSFTIVVFDCMEKLNIEFTRDEAEDYFYLWRMIAEMLGIRKDLIPENIDKAREMMRFIAKRQFGPSEDGKAMTRALLTMFELVIPGHVAEGNLYELIRYLVGEEIADWMEIPKQKQHGFFETLDESRIFRSVTHFFMSLPYLNKLGIDLIMRTLHFENQGPLFTIPEHLRLSWIQYDYEAEAAAAREEESL